MADGIYARKFGAIHKEDGSRIEFTVDIEQMAFERVVRRALHNKSGRSTIGPMTVTAIALDADKARRLDGK